MVLPSPPPAWLATLEAVRLHDKIARITKMKGTKKIVAVTAYDYTMGMLCEEGGADILLVGDSASMVMLGHPSTIPITIDEMCMFVGAVSRARKSATIIADMPFMSYQACAADAVRNAGMLVREGADAVKIEGPHTEAIRALVASGIPIMGHIGLQPQSASLSDGYSVRGQTAEDAERLIQEANMIQGAGAFGIVLEKVADQTAGQLSSMLRIPTVGIGSGPFCDGQVLVVHDMLGMYPSQLKFVKRYATLSEDIRQAISSYKSDVESGTFPAPEHSFPYEG